MFGVASYRDWETTNLQEEDGTEAPRRYFDTNNIEDSDIFYTELRFNYANDRINAIAGANYSSEDVFQRTDIHLKADSYMQFLTILGGFGGQDDHIWDTFGDNEAVYLGLTQAFGIAVLPPSFADEILTENMDNTGDFTNWGVFADVTYQLTDTIRVAAGLRYSYDDKEYSWQTSESDLQWPSPQERVAYNPAETGADPENWFDKFTDSKDWSKTTGRLVVDWEFSDQAMTYLSYGTGYKSGGFDGQTFQAFVAGPFDPEEMESIEWGLKGDFFDNRVRLEAAVFHQELDGRQKSVTAKQSPTDPTSQPTVINGDAWWAGKKNPAIRTPNIRYDLIGPLRSLLATCWFMPIMFTGKIPGPTLKPRSSKPVSGISRTSNALMPAYLGRTKMKPLRWHCGETIFWMRRPPVIPAVSWRETTPWAPPLPPLMTREPTVST
jgi:iron complex outermembrane receptor protein